MHGLVGVDWASPGGMCVCIRLRRSLGSNTYVWSLSLNFTLGHRAQRFINLRGSRRFKRDNASITSAFSNAYKDVSK